MSRGQLARTPENFPRMKHRAAGRVARRKAMEKMPKILDAFVEALRPTTEAFKRLGEAIGAIGHSMMIATRPQDWLPAQRQMIWPEQNRI